MNYPVFEDDEISEVMSDDFDEHSARGNVEAVFRNNKKNKKDERLADRTSEIISDYRDFLRELQMETSPDPPEDGFLDLHYYEHRIEIKNAKSRSHGDRAFSKGDSSSSGRKTCSLRELSMPSVPLGSSDVSEEDRKYGLQPALRSKRVKPGAFVGVGLLAVILVVIGISAKRSSSKMKLHKEENTPRWHTEVAFVLEHENGHEAERLPHYSAHAPREDSMPDPMAVEDVPPPQVLEPFVQIGEPDVENGQPVVRDNGLIAQKGMLKKSPESYMDYEAEEDSEDSESEEGEDEAKAVPTDTELSTVTKPEFKLNFPLKEMKMNTNIDSKAEEDSKNNIKADDEVKTVLTSTVTKTESELNFPAEDIEINTSKAASISSVATFDFRKILHDKFKPLWLSSREGWNGGSHDDAVQYCKNIRGKELCPYSVMCPYGPGHNVMAGRRPVDFSSQGEQYAPVYGHANRWILVGQKNGDPSTTCKSYEHLEMRPPIWGVNSEQREKKQHIMCCSIPANA